MRIYASLTILSESVFPEDIAESIGLDGHTKWLTGDKRGETEIVEQENGWAINSKEESSELENHLQSIKSQVSGREDKILALANTRGCIVNISCAIYSATEPPLYLERGTIDWISSMGANLDIDFFLTKRGGE